MATEIICPECGGVIFSSSNDGGRPCTCGGNDPNLTASSTATEAPSGKVKVCVNCGADVTFEKRLKDKEGNYWCVKCGSEDSRRKKEQALKAGGGAVVCPDCCGRFARDDLHPASGDLVCDKCLAKRIIAAKKSGKRKFAFKTDAASAEARRLKTMIAFAVLLIAIAIWRYL